MSQTKIIAIALATIVSVLSVQAQTSSPPPVCQKITGLPKVNATLFAGDWYEEIRAPSLNHSCVHINVRLISNNTELNVTSSYASSKTGLTRNKQNWAVINATEFNGNTGYNASSSNVGGVVTYKIIDTDYSSYAIACGFANASDESSSFSLLLTRDQILNSTRLAQLKAKAEPLVRPNLNDSTVPNVLQSKDCKNSAATAVPALALLFAAFYALLSFLGC